MQRVDSLQLKHFIVQSWHLLEFCTSDVLNAWIICWPAGCRQHAPITRQLPLRQRQQFSTHLHVGNGRVLPLGPGRFFYPFAVVCLANRQEKRPLAWPEDSEKKPQDRMNRPPCGQGLLFRGQSVQRCPLRGKPRSVDQSPSAASNSACCSVISASVSSTRSPSIT